MASSVKVNKITPTTSCGTVTLGDSGDTISIPSGASLNIGGTVSGIEGILNWDTTAKTSGFTAVAGNGYFVNTTSAPITVTLPATPSAGDLVGVKDYALTAQTNNITLARNGSNIQGTANDFIINTQGRSVTLIYVDGTQGWMITGASQASDISEQQLFVTATGGTITTCGNYKIHTFTGPGTFCVSCAGTAPGSNKVDYLVIAGGGAGGFDNAGGGGAGGFRESKTACAPWTASPLATSTSLPVSVTGYPITVGGGGATTTTSTSQNSGSNSIFSSITSAGGGGGGSDGAPVRTGLSGGSGGGGAGNSASPGGSGNTPPVSPPQGNSGGTGYYPGPISAGGGGGGASAIGATASGGGAGAGGNGATTSINATPTTRAGGGGGGAQGIPAGAGGSGGGGAGAGPGAPSQGTAGTTNTGGGGGGGGPGNNPCQFGGAGGSGIVIIRYKYQ